MKKALLIAEKPDMMLKIKAVYDKYGYKDKIVFKSFVGHVVALREPHEYKESWAKWDLNELPMIPEKFKYKPDKSKLKVYKELKEEIDKGNYDYIINSCDSGREGSHIFWAAITCMGGVSVPVKRLWLNDLTDKKIKEALENLRDEEEDWLKNLRSASQLRGYFDWGIGMNFTRAITLVANQKINVGRVMTPTLKMIVDRENSIKNFTPKDFWEIESDFGKYKGVYFYKLEDGKDTTQIFNKEEVENIKGLLGGKAVIETVTEERVEKKPPKLHSLDGLQKECNKLFGYTMSETLEIAQSLYEKQYISYPRTDSEYLTKSIALEFENILNVIGNVKDLSNEVDKILNNPSRIEEVSKNKRYVNDSKVSDHYAIIVTDSVPNLNNLTDKEKNVYITIAKRVLSIFMNPMATNKTTIITDNNGKKFKTVGNVLVDLGYQALYKSDFKDAIIPKVEEGEMLEVHGIEILAKKTSPPQRLDDGSLNDLMKWSGKLVEDKELKDVMNKAQGIGTPATRAGIVEKLVTLKMIERKGKSFYATDYGMSIIEQLEGQDISSVELTAKWEQKLSQIEVGEYSADAFYEEMVKYISETTENMKNMKVTIKSSKKIIGTCPNCGKDVIEGSKYYVCSGYSKEGNGCNLVIGKVMWGAKIPASEVKKLLEGKVTKEFQFKMEKDGVKKEWKTSLIYDNENKKLSFPKRENVKISDCPVCGGSIVEGKDYYLCSNYKKTCEVILPKKYLGASFSKQEIVSLLSGGESKEKSFKMEKDGQVKKWSSKVYYDLKERRIMFPKFEKKEVCKCSKCGGSIIMGKDYYLCSNYKKTCEVIIPKTYSGATITETEVVSLLEGRTLEEKKFKWKSGKEGNARLKYTGKLEFVFK